MWLVLLFNIKGDVRAQNDESPLLNIDDEAPFPRFGTWLKGEPITRFERGSIYVLEFWATWCIPCKAAMTHLSTLAQAYKGQIIIIGVNAYEEDSTPMEKIRSFVDSMGQRMDYHVVTGDSNFMVVDWMEASGERGIPKTFVVDEKGKLAWIGHPKDLVEVLQKIVAKSWDNREELARRNLYRHLAALEDSFRYKLVTYLDGPDKDMRKAKTMLAKINEIVQDEPRLKYAPLIAFFTFSGLLKTNPQKAFEYGKIAITTSTYEEPPYDMIIQAIKGYSGSSNLPAEIYALGAEAYRIQIQRLPYPTTLDMHKFYSNMAEWYWHAGNKQNAIDAGRKAIDAMKEKGRFTKADLAALEGRLQKYQAM